MRCPHVGASSEFFFFPLWISADSAPIRADSASTRVDLGRFPPKWVFNSQEPAYTRKGVNRANLVLVLTTIVDASNHHKMLLDL